MLADSIITTHTSTLPNAILDQDGLWYLPCVIRTSGAGMSAIIHVYDSNEDGSRGDWFQCIYGQGDSVNALVASVCEDGGIAEDTKAVYALREVAIACLFND